MKTPQPLKQMTWMRTPLPALLLLAALAAEAQPRVQTITVANTQLQAQSYQGKIKDGTDAQVDLVVLGPIPDREESFLGVLLREKPFRVDVFMIDPDDKVGYTLTPWKVTEDGEFGITNNNPTHVLTLEKAAPLANWNPFKVCAEHPYKDQGFKLTLAPGNRDALQASMYFDGRCSGKTLLDYLPGRYAEANRPGYDVTLAPLDSEDEVKAAFAGTAGLNNVYTIRRKQIALFNLRAERALGTGTVTAQFPKRIAFFLQGHRWYGTQDKFVLVDPDNNENVTVLKRTILQ
jgi:hypothetical protein